MHFVSEVTTDAYGIVLQCSDVGLHGLLHIACGHQCRCQIDVTIDEVGLETHSPPIVVQSLLQLTVLLVYVAQIAAVAKKQPDDLNGMFGHDELANCLPVCLR